MKLWTGFTIARVGSQITVLALPLTAVLLLGAGATETGLLVAAQMAPSIVAGPSLGGILVQALTAPLAMLWDAVGFLVSAVFIAAIRSTETPRPRETARSVWHEVTEGLRWVREQPIVLRSITAIALANIEWFAVQGVLVVYATRELGLSLAL